jgi:murein DD-endopeptidase MepM/ murein hydrolase activator NlpD
LRRIKRENERMRAVFAHYDARPVNQSVFEQPADGRISGTFGLRRFFNGEERQPHQGVDFAAATGTPVRAPADGKVALTGNFFFNGESIFLDHGQGVISMMNHLSRIDVREGQEIKRGEIIGAVGATGRATGPHLHWTLSLNNARVDPLLFLPPISEPTAPDAAPMQMGE